MTSTIRFDGLAVARAERLIAGIWLVLEATNAPSPAIFVTSPADDTFSVRLTFATASDADIVTRSLLGLSTDHDTPFVLR